MNNEESVKKAINETIKDATFPVLKESYNKLKISANSFLDAISTAYQSKKYLNDFGGNEEMARIWNEKFDIATEQQLSSAQASFSSDLDDFLGRQIYLTLVTSKGNLHLYSAESEEKIMSNVISPDGGRNKFNPSYWNKARQIKILPITLQGGETIDLINWIKNSVKTKSASYVKGVERYEEMYKSTKWSRRFYWWYSNRRGFPKTGFSRGQMAEGYANIVIQNDANFNQNAESSLKYLYDNWIYGKKEATEAIKKGDVSVDDDGNISLAVKYENASTARRGQYIAAAYYICQHDLLTKEQLDNWIQSMPKIHTYAAQVEEEGKNVAFEEILKKYSSVMTVDSK